MKNKIFTGISVCMLFVPWTILALRSFSWALESPVAEIMIFCYAVFMIISGGFTVLVYVKGRIQNGVMKICLIGNGMYAVFGVAVLALMGASGL